MHRGPVLEAVETKPVGGGPAQKARVESGPDSCWSSGLVDLKLEMVVGKMRGPTETLQFELRSDRNGTRSSVKMFGWTLPSLREFPAGNGT